MELPDYAGPEVVRQRADTKLSADIRPESHYSRGCQSHLLVAAAVSTLFYGSFTALKVPRIQQPEPYSPRSVGGE
jgi:hypothetical protein